MTRLLTLSIAAALIAAAPASAQSIRVSTAGKSPAEVRKAITKAAQKVCARSTSNSSFPLHEMAPA